MKKVQIIFMILLFAMVGTLSAQPPQRGVMGRAGITKFQSEQIANALELSGDRAAEFKALYLEYAEATKPMGHPREEHTAQPTEEQIEANILESFERSKGAIKVKEEFYYRFRELLSPGEVMKMYEMERYARDRFSREIRQRGGGE